MWTGKLRCVSKVFRHKLSRSMAPPNSRVIDDLAPCVNRQTVPLRQQIVRRGWNA